MYTYVKLESLNGVPTVKMQVEGGVVNMQCETLEAAKLLIAAITLTVDYSDITTEGF